MKKLLFVFLFFALVLGAAMAQEQVYYRTTVTLAWDAVTTIDGQPLLSGDTMEYEVYAWDVAGGDVLAQPVGSLVSIGTTAVPQIDWTVPYYAEWILGVRAKHTNGNNDVTYSDMAYTIEEVPVTLDGPFVYVLGAEATNLDKVQGLRDSGTP